MSDNKLVNEKKFMELISVSIKRKDLNKYVNNHKLINKYLPYHVINIE